MIKINLDGKKDSIEVLDAIFLGKINKKLVDNVLYKTNANYKGRHAKLNNKMKLLDQHQKFMHKKALEMQDMPVEKLQFLLVVVLLMVLKVNWHIKKEN